jgi:hypothetical protein
MKLEIVYILVEMNAQYGSTERFLIGIFDDTANGTVSKQDAITKAKKKFYTKRTIIETKDITINEDRLKDGTLK